MRFPTTVMSATSLAPITSLLRRWRNGDPAVLEQLLPAVYGELRRIAQRHLRRERPDHTLQPTAVVNELYLKLAEQHRIEWRNRAQFFGVASAIVRRILVDHVRSRRAEKRGGQAVLMSLDEAQGEPAGAVDLVRLDDALLSLSARDRQQARVVELRFFGGLSIEETAEVLSVSPSTVKRDWAAARAWLFRELSEERVP